MKLTKFFAVLVAFAAMSFVFTSCGDDDDDNGGPDPDGKVTAKFTKKTAEELELTLTSGSYSQVHYATFKANKLTLYTVASTFPTVEAAQAFYYETMEELESDGGEVKFAINGKTVTMDMTKMMKYDFEINEVENEYDAMYAYLDGMRKDFDR